MSEDSKVEAAKEASTEPNIDVEQEEERVTSAEPPNGKQDEGTDEISALCYPRELWEGSRVGYALYSKNKHFLNDMISVLSVRAAAEDRFAKELLTIHVKEATEGETPNTLETAWDTIRATNKQLADAHLASSGTLHQMLKQMKAQVNAESVEKKRIQSEDKALHAALNKAKSATESAKNKYMSAAEHEELARRRVEGGQALPPKKLRQLESAASKAHGELKKTHSAYKAQLKALHKTQQNFEVNMKQILLDLQTLEEKRTATLKEIMGSLVTLESTVADKKGAVLRAISEKVAAVDTRSDMQAWIAQNATGEVPEELVEEVTYEDHHDVIEAKTRDRKGTLGSKKNASNAKSPPKLNFLAPHKDNKDKKSPKSPKSPKETNLSPKRSVEESNTTSGAAALASPRALAKRTARALYAFEPTEEGELGFAVGDVLTIIRVDDSGWWDAEMGGKSGSVPGNRLQILDEAIGSNPDVVAAVETVAPVAEAAVEKKAEKEVATQPVLTAVPLARIKDAPDVRDSLVVDSGESLSEEEDDEVKPIGTVKALYAFAGDGDDELPLTVGEEIQVFQQVEQWYTGTNARGEFGMFPLPFVSPLVPIEEEVI